MHLIVFMYSFMMNKSVIEQIKIHTNGFFLLTISLKKG